MNILLAVDGSPYTKRMLGYIAAHDEFVGAANEFTAITVVPAIPPHVQRYISREDLDPLRRPREIAGEAVFLSGGLASLRLQELQPAVHRREDAIAKDGGGGLKRTAQSGGAFNLPEAVHQPELRFGKATSHDDLSLAHGCGQEWIHQFFVERQALGNGQESAGFEGFRRDAEQLP